MIRHIGKSALYLIIANVIFMVSGYGVHFFLARHFGPSGYGVYGVVISLMSSVNLILTAGLPAALAERISIEPSRRNQIWANALKLQVILAFTVTLAYFLLAAPISKLFRDESLVKFFALSALIFPTYSLYALVYGYNNGLKKFELQAFLLSVYSLTKVAVTVFLATFMGIYGAIMGFIVAPLLAVIVIGKPKTNKQQMSALQQKFDSTKLIKFALPFTVFSIAGALVASVDISMVKILLRDNALVGLYLAASTLARAPQNVYSAITTVAFPLIAGVREEPGGTVLRKTIRASVITSSGMIIISTVAVTILADFLVKVFYSEQYAASASLLVILAIGSAFYSFADLFSTITNGLGQPKVSAVVALFALPLAIILNYYLIPHYGVRGAAMATTTSSFILMLAAIACVTMVYRKTVR